MILGCRRPSHDLSVGIDSNFVKRLSIPRCLYPIREPECFDSHEIAMLVDLDSRELDATHEVKR